MTKQTILKALNLQAQNLELLNNEDYKHDSILSHYYLRLKLLINDLENEKRI